MATPKVMPFTIWRREQLPSDTDKLILRLELCANLLQGQDEQ